MRDDRRGIILFSQDLQGYLLSKPFPTYPKFCPNLVEVAPKEAQCILVVPKEAQVRACLFGGSDQMCSAIMPAPLVQLS